MLEITGGRVLVDVLMNNRGDGAERGCGIGSVVFFRRGVEFLRLNSICKLKIIP